MPPPPPQPSGFLAVVRATPVVVTTIGVNLIVFVLWQVARPQTGAPPQAFFDFMVENFLVSQAHLSEGFFWTMLTTAYSHIEMWHVLLNMFVLWNFGVTLERLWGWRRFLGFYLVCSIAGSACYLATTALLIGEDQPALGASGAVCGVLMAFALQYPRSRILVFGIVPVPALVGVLAFVAFDVWGLLEQARGAGLGIGHGAHLGGTIAGAALWWQRGLWTPSAGSA